MESPTRTFTTTEQLRSVFIAGCSDKALERAVRQIGPKKHRGGKFTMVVDNLSSGRLAAPLLQALNASSIQQKDSFLDGTLGQQVFPEELTVTDCARTPGQTGSRLFDSEGVATTECDIISEGTEVYGEVHNSVIGAGVIIKKGAVIRDSIIMKQSVIGENDVIDKAIIAENVTVGDNVVMGIGEEVPNKLKPNVYSFGLVTVGENTVIPSDVKIGKNTAIVGETTPEDYPGGVLESGETLNKEGETE